MTLENEKLIEKYLLQPGEILELATKRRFYSFDDFAKGLEWESGTKNYAKRVIGDSKDKILFKIKGVEFLIGETILTEIKETRAANLEMPKTVNISKRKKCICVQTGVVYDSYFLASKAFNVNPSRISEAVNKGLAIKFEGEWYTFKQFEGEIETNEVIEPQEEVIEEVQEDVVENIVIPVEEPVEEVQEQACIENDEYISFETYSSFIVIPVDKIKSMRGTNEQLEIVTDREHIFILDHKANELKSGIEIAKEFYKNRCIKETIKCVNYFVTNPKIRIVKEY
jgi:hypothetical protein